MDNLNIKGIEDDNPRRQGRVRGKARKPFIIEGRLMPNTNLPRRSVLRQLNLDKWWVWNRYMTAFRRDQAYAVLVKREERSNFRGWSRWEYRKRDD